MAKIEQPGLLVFAARNTHMAMFTHRLSSVVLASTLALAGCGGGLTVTRINSAEAKPNNVWVFFTVEKHEEPIAGLTAEEFAIYEDDKLVSQFESKQVIQNPEVAAVMYTLLLVDMSGSVTDSGEADTVVDAAQLFTEKVGKTQEVGVSAFDGEENIHTVVRFTGAKGSVEGGLEGLRTFKPKDPSTNLNGAVVQGLEQLDKALNKDKRPLKFGTLVVFTDGTDRAHRVSTEDMLEQLGDEKYANYEVFVIGVGAEIEEEALRQIGRDGTELAENETNVQQAFEHIADRIDRHARRFYLLSYCSPSRNGTHTVRIEARVDGEQGKGKGSLEYGFDAEGFGPPPQCDPERKPTFRLDKNLAPAPDKGKGKGKPKKTSVHGSGRFGQ